MISRVESGRFIFTGDAESASMVITEVVSPLWTEDVTVNDAAEATAIVSALVANFGVGILEAPAAEPASAPSDAPPASDTAVVSDDPAPAAKSAKAAK